MRRNIVDEDIKKENKKRKKLSKKAKIIIAIFSVLLVIVGICTYIVWSKLQKMEYVPLNEEELDVNNELYSEVGGLTQKEFDSVINIALFGSDSRNISDASEGRADSIMIASLNPKYKSIKLISIPRDTYVDVQGYGKTKINHAYAYGGEQLSIKTINNNFGLNINKYITVNFSGLINIINKVDGIELEITKEEMTVLNQYLQESCKISGTKYVPMTKYGKVTLDGEQALAHSRNRYVGNDFTRANRQRDVIVALMNKMSSMSKTKVYSLIDLFLKEVKTNINVTEYAGIIADVITNMGEYTKNVTSAQVPSTEYASGKTISGVYYFVSDMSKAKNDFIKYLYEK